MTRMTTDLLRVKTLTIYMVEMNDVHGNKAVYTNLDEVNEDNGVLSFFTKRGIRRCIPMTSILYYDIEYSM